MNFIFYSILLFFCLFFLNKFLLNKDILLSETGDNHQKYASKNKVPLTGGILVFFSFLFFLEENNFNLILFFLLILILGILSDLKLIKSASKRLLYQAIIVIIFVVLQDITIENTRVNLLDNFLDFQVFNYLFVCFCILIVMNGSNFFDGLNTLNVGYYFLICLTLFYLNIDEQLLTDHQLEKNLLVTLIGLYFFNLFNKVFIGDSGSILLGFIFSTFLIQIYYLNQYLSPFFIILLLWYPSFETLFSMIRKYAFGKSPLKPDSKHLHQLIFYYVKKKIIHKTIYANIVTANILNLYNLVIFSVALNFKTNTQIQILLILLNLIVYTVIYLKMFEFRFKKK